MANKPTTVTIPASSPSYKKADEIKLGAKRIGIPQAAGGNYGVTVGNSLSASETSMGRLASSLRGVNQALNAYADMSERREGKALDELRTMTNEQKAKLIGAENEVFRKMGIRPRSILQVKQSLGTIESGKFSADWTQKFNDEIIPNQSKDGSKLTSAQIQQKYKDFRSEWVKTNSDVLSRSQLATDGFIADTDGLYDRNAANFVARADTYYDTKVRDTSMLQDLYATYATNPELLAAKWEKLSEANDATGMREILKRIGSEAKEENTIEGYQRAQQMYDILQDEENGLKIGSEFIHKSMVIKTGLGALEEDLRSKTIGISNELETIARNEESAKAREARERYNEFRQARDSATTQAEKDALDEKYQQDVQKVDAGVGGLMLDLRDNLTTSQNALEAAERSAQERASNKLRNEILQPVHMAIYQEKSNEEIQGLLTSGEEELAEAQNRGDISVDTAAQLSSQLKEVNSVTNRTALLSGKVDAVVNSSKGESSDHLIAQQLMEADVMIAAKNELNIGKGVTAIELEKTSMKTDGSGYSFNANMLKDGAARVYADLRRDINIERRRLSEDAFLSIAKSTEGFNGDPTKAMDVMVQKGMAAYIETRTKQAANELVSVHESSEQAKLVEKARMSGLSVEEQALKEQAEAIKKKEANIEVLADRDVFTISNPDKDGRVDITIRNDWFDLDLSKPFTGELRHKHRQYIEGYELMFTAGNNLFEDLTDESKARLSARYREAVGMKREDGSTYNQHLITRMFESQGRLVSFTPQAPMGAPVVFPQVVGAGELPDARVTFINERKLITSFELGGIDTNSWMADDFGDERFSLRGPEGDYEQGLGYKYRENIPFVPVETIQRLYDDAELTKNDQLLIDSALANFYMPEGTNREDALGELLDNHRAIYENLQGYSFGDPENININDTDEDPRL